MHFRIHFIAPPRRLDRKERVMSHLTAPNQISFTRERYNALMELHVDFELTGVFNNAPFSIRTFRPSGREMLLVYVEPNDPMITPWSFRMTPENVTALGPTPDLEKLFGAIEAVMAAPNQPNVEHLGFITSRMRRIDVPEVTSEQRDARSLSDD